MTYQIYYSPEKPLLGAFNGNSLLSYAKKLPSHNPKLLFNMFYQN